MGNGQKEISRTAFGSDTYKFANLGHGEDSACLAEEPFLLALALALTLAGLSPLIFVFDITVKVAISCEHLQIGQLVIILVELLDEGVADSSTLRCAHGLRSSGLEVLLRLLNAHALLLAESELVPLLVAFH